MKISVSMITLNEEKHIERAIRSCSFADEVVVVDGGSTDGTVTRLESFDHVKLICHPWENHFGRQRQLALQHCSGDWVVRLDADEVFSMEFEQSIRSVLRTVPADIDGLRVRQCNLVGNENFYSKSSDLFESIPRIWRNRESIRWTSKIHESLVGLTGGIRNWDVYVVHYGFLDKMQYLRKGANYATIEGSMVDRPESLVYRNYDFQPRPDRARTANHVGPYPLPAPNSDKPQIAVVKGPHLQEEDIDIAIRLQETFDVTLYATDPSGPNRPSTQAPVVYLPKDPEVTTGMQGMEYALFDSDVIVSDSIIWPYTYQAARIKEKFQKKLVAIQAETRPFLHDDNPSLKRLKAFTRERVDVFIAESEMARTALQIEGVSPEKIALIPPGIDLSTTASARRAGGRDRLRQRLGICPSAFAVLLVDDFKDPSGAELFWFAAKLLQNRHRATHDQTRFVVAGQHADPISRLSENQAIDRDLRMVFDHHHQQAELLCASDLLVLPGTASGNGIDAFRSVLIDAMAQGVPIVTSASAQMVAIAGDTAVFIPLGDAAALATAIHRLVNDADQRRRMARLASQRANERFSLDAQVRALERLFLSLCR